MESLQREEPWCSAGRYWSGWLSSDHGCGRSRRDRCRGGVVEGWRTVVGDVVDEAVVDPQPAGATAAMRASVAWRTLRWVWRSRRTGPRRPRSWMCGGA